MVGDVDPAAGVDVVEPGAADVGVLLEDGEVDAGLAEAVGGDDARHAGADDGHREGPVRRDLVVAPAGRPVVGLVEGELLVDQLEELRVAPRHR